MKELKTLPEICGLHTIWESINQKLSCAFVGINDYKVNSQKKRKFDARSYEDDDVKKINT